MQVPGSTEMVTRDNGIRVGSLEKLVSSNDVKLGHCFLNYEVGLDVVARLLFAFFLMITIFTSFVGVTITRAR